MPLPDPATKNTSRRLQWTDLPAEGRTGAPPKLPPLRDWHADTLAAWRHWWSTPQATAWDQSGRSLHRWAILYDRIASDPTAPASLHAAMTAIEDRHAFTPVAMAKLRWRVVVDEVASKRTTRKPAAAKVTALDRLRSS